MELTSKNGSIAIEYIDTAEKLIYCENHLSKCNEIAFDLEFDRDRYRYGFNLCLIQLFAGERCFIIDPLVGLNLSKLYSIFENQTICKIAFSASEDLKLLNLQNCFPKNIFDIDIASRLLNYEPAGLSMVIELKLNIVVEKKSQKSNWSKRPLTMEQIQYSADDVIHLIEIKNIFEKEGKEKGVLNWIAEENSTLDNLFYDGKKSDELIKKEDKKSLNPFNQYVLNELLKYREKIAEKVDRPSAHVLDKKILLSLVKNEIKIDDWMAVKGGHPQIKNSNFQDFYKKVIMEAERQNLSREKSTFFDYQNREKTQERMEEYERKDNIKATRFYPIKKVLTAKYGELTARHILSETKINELVNGKTKLADFVLKYKINEIGAIATNLRIDLSEYQ